MLIKCELVTPPQPSVIFLYTIVTLIAKSWYGVYIVRTNSPTE